MVHLNKEIKRILIELNELADSRKYIVDKLRSLASPYIEHICKVILWGDQNSDWLDDWSDEIFNFIKQSTDLKPKNSKVLKFKDLEKLFFFKIAEDADELFFRLERTANDLIQRKNYPQVSYYNKHEIFKLYKTLIKKFEKYIQPLSIDYNGVKDAVKWFSNECRR